MLIWGPFWVSVWGLGVEGCWFGSPVAFWGPGVLIWGPFWVSVWGLGVEGCRQQLKVKNSTPLERQARFAQKVSPALCSLSVVICVFLFFQNSTKTHQSRRTF